MDGKTIIPNWAIWDSDLDGQEMLVYLALLSRRNSKTGKCWPGIATIADDARCSRSTAKRTIRRLEERGLIRIEHRAKGAGGHDSNIYRVALLPDRMPEATTSAKGTRIPKRQNHAGSVLPDPRVGSPRPGGRVSQTHEQDEGNKTKGTNEGHRSSLTARHDPDHRTSSSPALHNSTPDRSDDDPEIEISQEPIAESMDEPLPPSPLPATPGQIAYLTDLRILGGNDAPDPETLAGWARLSRAQASAEISAALAGIDRHESYSGPEAGDPAYSLLSTTGQGWADARMIPEEVTA